MDTKRLILVLACIFLVAGGRTENGTLRARRIEIVDDQGRVRITLDGGISDGRVPQIKLLDPEQRELVVIAGSPDGPGISLVDGNGIDRVSMMTKDTQSGFALRDPAGMTRVLIVHNKRRTGIALVESSPEAPAGVTIDARSGTARLTLEGVTTTSRAGDAAP